MKLVKRITAVGLSALLAAGTALPALAAEGATEKSETVYVVLEPDGSVRSQTVSAHLHNEAGLSGVSDRSSLTGIENTHDTASFTQNGQELSWDTDGTDIYYKGESSREAPIQAEIRYQLDGQAVEPDELEGRSGRLTLTIRLTNTETGTAQIGGRSRQVCTPFITMVAAVLGEGWENVSAPHGTVKGVGKSQAAGFVCLPGVRSCLEDAGAERLEEAEDLLLDEVVIEADVADAAVPDILIACATDTETLRENGFSGLDKLEGLEDGMDSLSSGMDELLDGADQLAEGAKALESGAAALLAGVNTLYQGAQPLQDGAVQLQQGAHQLSSGAVEARDGAAALQAGAGDLTAGLWELQNGAGALADGYYQLKSGSESLAGGLNTLQGSSQALNDGASQLAAGIASLYAAVGPEGQVAIGAQAFGAALSAAAENAGASLGQLPDPAAFAQSPLAEDPAFQQLLAAYTGAYGAASSLAGGLGELNGSYAQLQAGLEQVSQGAQALEAGANGENGLASGVAAYTQGVASAAAGAAQLDAGLGQLGQNLPALTSGVNQLIDGSNRLSAGAGSLSRGNAALAEGAAQLARGIDDLAVGVPELLDGITALAEGASALQAGAGQLSEGASAMQEGLGRFDQEGISRLTDSAEKLPELKELASVMQERLESYGSFAGAPEGAEVTTRFVMKTAVQPKEEQDDAGAAQEEEHESLWQRIAGLLS